MNDTNNYIRLCRIFAFHHIAQQLGKICCFQKEIYLCIGGIVQMTEELDWTKLMKLI